MTDLSSRLASRECQSSFEVYDKDDKGKWDKFWMNKIPEEIM